MERHEEMRATERRRRARSAVLIALVLPLAAVLGACSATTVAAPPAATDVAAQTTSPAPEPVGPADPLEEVVAAVLRPDVLELRDAAGAVVTEVDYLGDADDAVATLAVVFGAEPESEPIEPSLHFPGGIAHRWDGFTLLETHYDEERRAAEDLDNLVWPRLVATARAAEVGGIELTTEGGVHVGDALDDLAEVLDAAEPTCAGWALETFGFERERGPAEVAVSLGNWDADSESPTYGEQVEEVTTLVAPSSVGEGCV